jgi:hypothetical protein
MGWNSQTDNLGTKWASSISGPAFSATGNVTLYAMWLSSDFSYSTGYISDMSGEPIKYLLWVVGCSSSVTAPVVPAGVDIVDQPAFRNRSDISSVSLPASVTNIDDYAFSNCSALTDLYLARTTPPTLGGNMVFSGTNAGLTIHVPAASLAAYQAASNWSAHASKMVGY